MSPSAESFHDFISAISDFMMAAKRSRRITIEEHFNKIFKVFINFGTTEPTLIALACWIIIILGSWICDFHRPPDFYLSSKRSIFNVLFAKWSMAWTLGLVTSYVALTNWIKSRYNLKVVCKNALRLLVAFLVWLAVTSFLDWVEHLSGKCSGSDLYSTKMECRREGLLWSGYDISGHSFILTYCALVISEELQVVRFWTDEKNPHSKNIHDNKNYHFKDSIVSSERMYANEGAHILQEEFVTARYVSNVLYILCFALLLLWLILLAVTAMYYHTAESKVGGVSIGLSAWLCTYKLYFWSEYFPGSATGF